jgi:hypothetical protein
VWFVYGKDQAETAKLAGVTRTSVTQIMNLLGLVAELQEELLVARRPQDSNCLRERTLRHVAIIANWKTQRKFWIQ